MKCIDANTFTRVPKSSNSNATLPVSGAKLQDKQTSAQDSDTDNNPVHVMGKCTRASMHIIYERAICIDFAYAEQPPADNLHRSHSTATSKSRQRSQSTTSVNSGVAQKQWYDGTHAHSIQDMSRQMTPEAMVMHSASQLQNPRGYGIDPALGGVSDHMGYGQHMQYKPDSSHHQIAYEGYIGNYGEGESQIMEGRSDEQDDIESVGGSVAAGKKAVKSSAANEKEMRELFRANQYRSLPEVAAELHGNERGPNSERQRQVFAMLWYVSRTMLRLSLTDCPLGSTMNAIKAKAPFLAVVYTEVT